jgi:Tol biopolymer transport system component
MRFSPDGSRIRFTVSDLVYNTDAIWEALADGSGAHPLLPGWNNPSQETGGTWTSDGRYFLFSSRRDLASNIWVLPETSSVWHKISHQPVQLTAGPLEFAQFIPSKDGKKLFVVGVQPRAELVRFDAKLGQFFPYLGGISGGDVDFSRDGKWVTYVLYPEGTLWRSKLDGSERLQLTYSPMQTALAHWSPDGMQIAFSATFPGKPWKLFLISKDGGSSQPITSDDKGQTDPTWSPDGNELAFGFNDTSNPSQIFVDLLDLNSRKASHLPGSQGFFGPRWSPDGHYIVALTSDNAKMVLFDFKTQQWRQLLTNLGFLGYLAWSPDSAYIYFDTGGSQDAGYFRLRVRDSKLEKIFSLKEFRSFPNQFGGGSSWTGLGPGQTPLLVRDISTQEIYALDVELP